jgi:hypothetical protein
VNMMKVIVFVLLPMSLGLQGCMLLAVGAGAAAGAGTMAYIEGEFQTAYASSIDRTWNASLEAVKDLDFRIIATEKKETEGNIEAKKLGGKKVRIALSIAGPEITFVRIRVGIFGDEAASRVIRDRIASRLENN